MENDDNRNEWGLLVSLITDLDMYCMLSSMEEGICKAFDIVWTAFILDRHD